MTGLYTVVLADQVWRSYLTRQGGLRVKLLGALTSNQYMRPLGFRVLEASCAVGD